LEGERSEGGKEEEEERGVFCLLPVADMEKRGRGSLSRNEEEERGNESKKERTQEGQTDGRKEGRKEGRREEGRKGGRKKRTQKFGEFCGQLS
jgi:hypothetical protein